MTHSESAASYYSTSGLSHGERMPLNQVILYLYQGIVKSMHDVLVYASDLFNLPRSEVTKEIDYSICCSIARLTR